MRTPMFLIYAFLFMYYLSSSGNEIGDNATQQQDITINEQTPIQLAPISLQCPNKQDSLGRKVGYWCEPHEWGDGLIFKFYKNGKANGLARCYIKSNFEEYYLFAVGQYENDDEIGQWQFFYPDGKIYLIADSLSKNVRFLNEAIRFGYCNPESTRQYYAIDYDTLGYRFAEGWSFYMGGTMGDIVVDGKEVGTYKIYNKDGSVTTKSYGK